MRSDPGRPSGPDTAAAPPDKVSAARDAILSATAVLLTEQGLGATRTRDVTARAGVSTGLLNHYFTWRALRAEALGLALRAGLDAVLPEASGTPADPRGDLERLARGAFDEGADPLWRLWVEATEAAPGDPAVARVLAQATGELVARIADRLAQGARLGLWRCSDPQGAAFRLMALHDGLAGLILSGLPGLTRADATAHLATALSLECPPLEGPR
ncbi:MAG: TetR family transcriptional regulator C-terminal domain-containing protein [Gemmobacter sp.]